MPYDVDPLLPSLLQRLTAHAALACETPLAWLRTHGAGGAPLCVVHGAGAIDAGAPMFAALSAADTLVHLTDAQSEPSVRDDPLVATLGIRLLASLPLYLPSGAKVGHLCVADRVARTLSARQVELLRDVAALGSDVIALAQREAPRRTSTVTVAAPVAAAPAVADGCSRCASCLPDGLGREAASEEEVRAAVRRQTDVLRMVTEAIPATVVVVGRDGRYHFANSAFERYAGLPRRQIIGRTAVEVLGEVEVARRRPWMTRALGGESVTFTLDYPSADGNHYLELTCIPLKMDGGDVDGFVGISQDVTAQRREQERLTEQARHDPLTGLLNRAAFEQQIQLQVRQGRGGQLGVLYIDLDFFKPVNDTFGHATGDSVLKQFAQRLRSLVRPTDTVARLGGDEFAVLLIGLREPANATMVAGKVVAAAKQPFSTDAGELNIGASVGVACGVNETLGWRELIGRADAQLYRAKAAGRGTAR